MTHSLLDLNQFVKDHPPRDFGEGPWRERAAHELFLQPSVRVRLAIDQVADIGFGLWRDEKLAEEGIYASDADSLAFASRLNATLGEFLSIRNLEHLVKVLSEELAEAEARRQAAALSDNLQKPID
jgi:hypothetical protein